MINPFLKEGCLRLNASINKVAIEDYPNISISEDLRGKKAGDIFSASLLIDEIKKNSKELKLDINNIEEKSLPFYLEKALDSDEISVNYTANSIMKKFGERLGVILLVIKQGRKANRDSRSDWNELNWEYLRQLDNVILTGGLASGNIGSQLKHYVEEVFKEADEKCYNIILVNDSSNIGVKGCTTLIKDKREDNINIVLDLGQSYIKRSIVKSNGEIVNLEKVLSKYVNWEYSDGRQEKEDAIKLHEHILSVLTDTINDIEDKSVIGDEIVMSIANYVNNGVLANRGGYGKLRLLAPNYEEFLRKELYDFYNKDFKIKLVHDGTAMASAFKKYKNSVCISLGTAFGIGFTQ